MDMKRIEKVDRTLADELHKQEYIIYGCATIAFSRYWGFGENKIFKIFERANEVWDECSAYGTTKSIMEMLYDDTGIEMRLTANGKSFREIAFFNANLKVGTKDTMTKEQWFLMRQMQIKWAAPSVMASLFLTLNRYYGFGAVRLKRIMEQIEDIREEYKYNPTQIKRAVQECSGFKIEDVFKRGA